MSANKCQRMGGLGVSESKNRETPISDDIVSDLHNGLESAAQQSCTCGSNPEGSCKHCDQWTRAMDKAGSAIGEIEIELADTKAELEFEREQSKGLALRLDSYTHSCQRAHRREKQCVSCLIQELRAKLAEAEKDREIYRAILSELANATKAPGVQPGSASHSRYIVSGALVLRAMAATYHDDQAIDTDNGAKQ